MRDIVRAEVRAGERAGGLASVYAGSELAGGACVQARGSAGATTGGWRSASRASDWRAVSELVCVISPQFCAIHVVSCVVLWAHFFRVPSEACLGKMKNMRKTMFYDVFQFLPDSLRELFLPCSFRHKARCTHNGRKITQRTRKEPLRRRNDNTARHTLL